MNEKGQLRLSRKALLPDESPSGQPSDAESTTDSEEQTKDSPKRVRQIVRKPSFAKSTSSAKSQPYINEEKLKVNAKEAQGGS